VRAAIAGINAVVVGILGAALYDPLWKTGIVHPLDAAIAVGGCAALATSRVPPLLLVAATVALEVTAAAS
jgi:chromate transporter